MIDISRMNNNGAMKIKLVKTYKHLVHGTISDSANGVTQSVCKKKHSFSWPYFTSPLKILHSSSINLSIIASYYNFSISHILKTISKSQEWGERAGAERSLIIFVLCFALNILLMIIYMKGPV